MKHAERLGISYALYYKKIRIQLARMVKSKPDEIIRKKENDENWDRVTESWRMTIEKDKKFGR